jgi:hypothetical protein
MRRHYWFLVVVAVLVAVASFAATQPPFARAQRPAVVTGMEDIHVNAATMPRPQAHTLDEDTIIGSQYLAGTSWYDLQHNGTFGKQIAVGADGWVQMVWTNGLDQGIVTRRVYYNAWDPSSELWAQDGGIQVDNGARAGFANIALDHRGIAFPVYHQIVTGSIAHSAYGIDYDPHFGAFNRFDMMPYVNGNANMQVIWPAVDVDIEGHVHTVSTDFNAPQLHWYNGGTPHFNNQNHGDSVHWGGFTSMNDSNTFITADIACSFRTQRIAMAWIFDPATQTNVGGNVFLKISEDGGQNWGETQNITNFTNVDTNCIHNGGVREECNKDTLRPWIDLSILMDQNDMVHVAFSTWGWFYWENINGVDSVGPWIHNDRASKIWHWDESNREYNIVASRYYGTLAETVGSNNLMCHRPSLAIDTTTGYLYCSYQQFDTTQYSDQGYLAADAYVTVSTDGGRYWAEGTDVTKTDNGQDTPAPNGKSERAISIAKFVSNGYVHMQYELDHDAGTAVTTTPEGTATLNEFYYLRIPTDSINTTPILSAEPLRWDSTGYPPFTAVTQHPTLKPGQFALYQNYPNPFNPTTTIQFDLASQSVVSLRVFDVLGREVSTLVNKQSLSAGVHMMSFDAANLASGVYFYRLETPKMTETRKMVVMK